MLCHFFLWLTRMQLNLKCFLQRTQGHPNADKSLPCLTKGMAKDRAFSLRAQAQHTCVINPNTLTRCYRTKKGSTLLRHAEAEIHKGLTCSPVHCPAIHLKPGTDTLIAKDRDCHRLHYEAHTYQRGGIRTGYTLSLYCTAEDMQMSRIL